jgi:hypothetical protein
MADGNWGIDTWSMPLNAKVNFKLVCIGKSVSLTTVGGTWNATQPRARPTGKATVWLVDPWHAVPNALIENLCYTPIVAEGFTSSNTYTCSTLVDHGGSDIQCVNGYTSYVGKMIKAACDGDPNCKSYNTFINGNIHGGCIKVRSNITNRNDAVKEFCVKA